MDEVETTSRTQFVNLERADIISAPSKAVEIVQAAPSMQWGRLIPTSPVGRSSFGRWTGHVLTVAGGANDRPLAPTHLPTELPSSASGRNRSDSRDERLALRRDEGAAARMRKVAGDTRTWEGCGRELTEPALVVRTPEGDAVVVPGLRQADPPSHTAILRRPNWVPTSRRRQRDARRGEAPDVVWRCGSQRAQQPEHIRPGDARARCLWPPRPRNAGPGGDDRLVDHSAYGDWQEGLLVRHGRAIHVSAHGRNRAQAENGGLLAAWALRCAATM